MIPEFADTIYLAILLAAGFLALLASVMVVWQVIRRPSGNAVAGGFELEAAAAAVVTSPPAGPDGPVCNEIGPAQGFPGTVRQGYQTGIACGPVAA